MDFYEINISGFRDQEPTVNLNFRGFYKNGNADLEQVTSIAYELKNTLKKLQEINLARIIEAE